MAKLYPWMGGRKPKYTEEEINEFAFEFMEWWEDKENVWFKDFCLERKIDPDLIGQWAKTNEIWAEVHKYAKDMQESRLVNGGLKKVYSDPQVARTLAHCHGWKNNQEITVNNGSTLASYIQEGDGQTKDLVNYERNDK
jgi:hypothetical protein